VTDGAVIRSKVENALATLVGPDGLSLATSQRLSEITITNARVYLSIRVSPQEAARYEPQRRAAEEAIRAVPGVASAIVALTNERAPSPATRPPAAPDAASTLPDALAGVRFVIAVASGKGGVGKSTTACNLGLAFRALGLRVGVLDADIYGPSMPKLFALRAKPKVVGERTLVPLDGYGCKVMSIGFVIEESRALVWRGPMVMGAVNQMLKEVAWGELDVLVVDMPPGTGDAQLTLAQNARLAGAVIVSTPQDLALIDARRGVAMFRQVGVPILGLIENMSWFVCDQCGKRHEIFAHGGARVEAQKLGVPLLGEIALDPTIRERSDAGLPVVVTEPDGPHAATYIAIARQIWSRLSGSAPS
jgi:ATP-binding protein involved in chromosome partitioning